MHSNRLRTSRTGHGSVRRLLVGAAVAALTVSTLGVAQASAQDCTGTISTSVTAESLPGGNWSVSDACLTADSFYEYKDGPVLAKAGVSTATYADGHEGRVAAGLLTLGNGIGLSIVGVEDSATGLVKWSAVMGEFTSEGDRVSVDGDGVALFPVEHANVSLSFTGTGTDVGHLLDEAVPPSDEGVPAEPEVTEPTPETSIAPSTTVEESPSPSTTAAPEPTAPATTAPPPPPAPEAPEFPGGSGSPATTVPGDTPVGSPAE